MMERKQIMEIRVYTLLDPGILGAAEIGQRPYPTWPATRAGLATALDYAQREQISNRGSYGNIGMGRMEVRVSDGELELIVGREISESEAYGLMPHDGSLKLADLLDDTVWNGDNHIPFRAEHQHAFLRRRWRVSRGLPVA